MQRRSFYKLTATIKHRGHYYHEMCTDIDVYRADGDADSATIDTMKQTLRDFMRWIYRQLEAEYDWRNSDEQIDESIRCNEYEFEESGKRA